MTPQVMWPPPSPWFSLLEWSVENAPKNTKPSLIRQPIETVAEDVANLNISEDEEKTEYVPIQSQPAKRERGRPKKDSTEKRMKSLK